MRSCLWDAAPQPSAKDQGALSMGFLVAVTPDRSKQLHAGHERPHLAARVNASLNPPDMDQESGL
ncbi:hypothetical protein A6A40_05685 [Azospirillum humicireducens]|uniref:Uncharacterized protein n=1 Tax=Azospirillum humicireducens TaxID=1226968 RepID=A0A160JF58_9PROT|nr:hypothetical protein A6A40_05685 [Azospirillum humicireducens]